MEGAEDLHIFLNSRFNVNEFPLNTSNGFTNVIKPSLALDSSYEVALENFIFEPDIFTIREGDKKYMVHVKVSFTDVDGGFGHYMARYFPTKNFKAENVFQLVHILDNDITEFLIKERIIKKDQGYIFRMVSHDSIDFKELNLRQNHKTHDVEWNLGEGIARVMGIGETTFMNKAKLNITPLFPKKLSCIYVYCDIIEPTYLGEQSVHLLDVIPLPHMHFKQGSLTIYKRVNRNVIDNISIRITDENGENINFEEHVSITAVLHFKRI